MRKGGRAPGIWRFALEDAGRERLLIVVLDRRQRIIDVGEVPAASMTTGHVHRIFQDIPLARVAGFLSVHSQPGGSRAVNDAAVVKRLKAIAEEIGVPLLDHVRFRRGSLSLDG